MATSASRVHFRFRTARKAWDTITFYGSVITVLNLKRAIVAQKKLNKESADFDLHISNAQTGEEYRSDNFLIPRNTSVVVRRIPATRAQALKVKMIDNIEQMLLPAAGQIGAGGMPTELPTVPVDAPAAGTPSAEQEAMMAVLNNASNYSRPQGRPTQRFGAPTRPQFNAQPSSADTAPPPGYTCHRCGLSGHFIKFCPTNTDPDFKPVGRGATQSRGGGFGRNFWKPVMDPKRLESEAPVAPVAPANGTPPVDPTAQRVQCDLCRKPFTDCVAMPCCYISFCRACVLNHLRTKGEGGTGPCPVACGNTTLHIKNVHNNAPLQRMADVHAGRPPTTTTPHAPGPAPVAAAPAPAPGPMDPRARDPRMQGRPMGGDPRQSDPRSRPMPDARQSDPRSRPTGGDPRQSDPRSRPMPDPRQSDPRRGDPRQMHDPRRSGDPRAQMQMHGDPRARDPRGRDPRAPRQRSRSRSPPRAGYAPQGYQQRRDGR